MHLTDEELKAAVLYATNKLIENKDEILNSFQEIGTELLCSCRSHHGIQQRRYPHNLQKRQRDLRLAAVISSSAQNKK